MIQPTRMNFLKAGTLHGVPAFLLVMMISLSAIGCDRITPVPSAPANFAAPSPGRDELYVAGPHRLSMSAYEGLRREFPGLTPTDAAHFALATQWFADAEKTTLKDAAQCMRALFAPPLARDVLAKIEIRLKSSSGVQTIEALRERWANAVSLRAIEWNLPLAKDYGIDPSSLGRNSR